MKHERFDKNKTECRVKKGDVLFYPGRWLSIATKNGDLEYRNSTGSVSFISSGTNIKDGGIVVIGIEIICARKSLK